MGEITHSDLANVKQYVYRVWNAAFGSAACLLYVNLSYGSFFPPSTFAAGFP
jgi:hypothetical protein